jgi:hypothetical protein
MAIPEATADSQRMRRRILQFNLPTLFLIVTAAAVWLSIILTHSETLGLGAVLFGFPIGIAGFFFFVRLSHSLNRRTPNLKALAACALAACGLSVLSLEWPFRSVTITLISWFRALAFAPHVTGFVVFLFVLLAVFQLTLVIRMSSVVSHGGKRAAIALVGFLLTLVLLSFVAFPKVQGYWRYHRLVGTPSQTVIEFTSPAGYVGERPEFVVATHADQVVIRNWDGFPTRVFLSPEPTVVIVTEERMVQLLHLLRREGFFDLDFCLYPYGTIDGTWETLCVTSGDCQHKVASYAGTEQAKPFDVLVARLKAELRIADLGSGKPARRISKLQLETAQ